MEGTLSTVIDSSNKLKDEDLFIASKNWNRLVTAASTIGYKEGIEDGQESVFQEGFDMGYKDAFDVAFTLGKYKGLISSTQRYVQLPSLIDNILDKTKKGICYICKEESQNKVFAEEIEDMPFVDVRRKQKVHSTDAIKILHEYFESIVVGESIDVC